jgi:FkbM family methyltransferase
VGVFGGIHLSVLRKKLRRAIRYNGIVERAQQIARRDPTLFLEPINLRIEVRQTDILIDCGANVGDVTSAFARTGAKVYAFEPSPVSYAIVKKRFSATPNVTIFNKGVMDKHCYLSLATPVAHDKFDDVDSTVSASFVNDNLPPSSLTSVECVDLSAFIRSVGNIRLLKLDIEGAEIQVLNSLLDTGAIEQVDLIVVETHEHQIPSLAKKTEELRQRIGASTFAARVRLDWI